MTTAQRILVGCLLPWLGIFLVETVYPDARSFYRGIRGRQHSWAERFQDHGRLQSFIAQTSPTTAAAAGRVLFAYGGDPALVRMGHLQGAGYFMAAAKYLLYPARPFAHPNGILTNISHIAVYQSAAEIFPRLSFCGQVGEKNYLCRVKPSDAPLYHVTYRYESPDLSVIVRDGQRSRSTPAMLILAFIFSPRDLPIKESTDVNVLLAAAGVAGDLPGGEDVYRLHLPLAGLEHLRTYRLQLFGVDRNGLLWADNEHRLFLDQ